MKRLLSKELLIVALIRFTISAAATTVYPGGKWSPGPARYGVERVNNVCITMDDGIILNASIDYPLDLKTGKRCKQKFPVAIEYTPYKRFVNSIEPIDYFAEHGYISVVVWARGTGKSEGEFGMLNKRDQLDGVKIVNWAAHNLPGSDGRVAMLGCSFPAGLALTTAMSVGPNSPLKAIVCANNGFESALRQSWLINGIPTVGFKTYSTAGHILYGDNEASIRFFNKIKDEVNQGDDIAHDGLYWSQRPKMEDAIKVVKNKIPVLLQSGYHDILDVPALKTFIALQNAYAGKPVFAPMQKGQAISSRYQIIMGGWEHAYALDLGIYLEWLDTWVKGINTGLAEVTTPMHLYEGGSNRWFNTSVYPITDKYTSMNLTVNHTLQSNKQEITSGTLSLKWDKPENKESNLVFQTEPLTDSCLIAGPISLDLNVSSSNKNMEIIARLYDLFSDGTKNEISRGAIIGSQKEVDSLKSWKTKEGFMAWPWLKLSHDKYLVQDSIYCIHIALSPRQWCIARGHTLQLELTTQSPETICPSNGSPTVNSDAPGYPNIPMSKSLPNGIYTIHIGGNSPSVLHIPIVCKNSFNYVPSSLVSPKIT